MKKEFGTLHDATEIAPVTPVCILFVKCFKSISQNPLEKVELKDIAIPLEISGDFIQQVIQQ